MCYSENTRKKCKPKLLQIFLYFSIMEILLFGGGIVKLNLKNSLFIDS